MDKAKLEHEKRIGERAQRLLEDELVVSAFNAMRARAISDFKNASPDNEHALVLARLRFGVTEDLLNEFTKHVNNAIMADDRLKRVEH